MLKRHTFWIKTTIVLQFITAALHSLSFVMKPEPANDTERQLLELMNTYRMDDGMGFTPTFQNMFNALSACFTLLYLFGGIINIFLLQQKAPLHILRGMVSIQFFLFGIAFAIMATLTFLPPIVCTALVFIALFATRLTIPKPEV